MRFVHLVRILALALAVGLTLDRVLIVIFTIAPNLVLVLIVVLSPDLKSRS